jgi:O-antigen ligase
MVADLVRTPDDYRGLLTGIALGSIPVLIFVIADLISGRSFLGTEPTLFYGSEAAFELGIRRVTSTFYDPNALGRYLAFVSISSLGLLVRSPRRSITLLVSALVVAQVGALLVTSSRGALLALAFGIVTMIAATLVWGRRRIRVPGGVILLLTLGVGGLVAVLSPVILERLSQALEGDARLTLLSGGLKIAQSRPLFGFGIGHVEEAMTPVLGRPMATHNLYLEVLLAFGGIGLILFLGYTGSILARGLAEFRRNGSAQMLTAIASLTAMLVMGLTLHGIQADEPWLAIGLCAAAAHLTRDEHSVQNAPAQPPR